MICYTAAAHRCAVKRCRSCGDLQPIRSATPVLPGPDEEEASVDAVRAALASLGSYTTTSSRWYAAIWEGWVSGASAAPEREGTRRCGYAHTIIATPALRAITHVARSAATYVFSDRSGRRRLG